MHRLHRHLPPPVPRADAAPPGGGAQARRLPHRLDLYQEQGWDDALTSAVALPVDVLFRLAKMGRLRSLPETRQVWAAHGLHDGYLTLGEIRALCARPLPGARVKKYLFWRFSLVWKKAG